MDVKERFEAVANEYLRLFCEKHGYDFEDARDCWVGDRVGEITEVGDRFVDLRDIRTDIDRDAPVGEFEAWNDYCLRLGYISPEIACPNYEHWLMGAPRKSEEQIAELEELHRHVEQARKALENAIKQENF